MNRYIFVQEEYGYRHWVGQVPNNMTIEQIITWWESLNSVNFLFFNPSKRFIVPLHEVEDVANEDAEVATWSWTDDQEKHILNRDTVIAFFHVHEDEDSYMKAVGGDHHYHVGYDIDEDDDEMRSENGNNSFSS